MHEINLLLARARLDKVSINGLIDEDSWTSPDKCGVEGNLFKNTIEVARANVGAQNTSVSITTLQSD